MGFLAGVLGGIGNAAAEDRRKKFDANERERASAIESLNKVLLDPNSSDDEKKAAATQLQAGHAAPIGKPSTWYKPDKIFVPPAPPTAEQQLAMVRGQAPPPQAAPQTVNAPLTLGGATGGPTLPGTYAVPQPPPGVSAPGNAPPATPASVATPQPPPGMAGSTATMTGQPQEIPAGLVPQSEAERRMIRASRFQVAMEQERFHAKLKTLQSDPAFSSLSQREQLEMATGTSLPRNVVAVGPGQTLVNIDTGKTIGPALSGGAVSYEPHFQGNMVVGVDVTRPGFPKTLLTPGEAAKIPEAKAQYDNAVQVAQGIEDKQERKETRMLGRSLAVQQQAFQNALATDDVREANKASGEARKIYNTAATDLRTSQVGLVQAAAAVKQANAGNGIADITLVGAALGKASGVSGQKIRVTQFEWNQLVTARPYLQGAQVKYEHGMVSGAILSPEQRQSILQEMGDTVKAKQMNVESIKSQYGDVLAPTTAAATIQKKGSPGVRVKGASPKSPSAPPDNDPLGILK